jgi:hypothetical protein
LKKIREYAIIDNRTEADAYLPLLIVKGGEVSEGAAAALETTI